MIILGKERCGITEEAPYVTPISATRKRNVTLAGNCASLNKIARSTLCDRKRDQNVNLFVIDVANMYVLNTRTFFASTVLSLILLLPLLFFLFSFVLICKCVQGLCYCLCLFASGLVVCGGRCSCETHKRNQ